MKVHTVYVYRDRDGRALYVGVTNRGRRRGNEHSSKPWFVLVASADFRHFADRDLAEACEVATIRRERPVFNVRHASPVSYVPPPVDVEWLA